MFSMTILKCDEAIKNHVTFVAILVLFKRSYVVSPVEFHNQDLTGLGFMTWGNGIFLHPPPGYLMSNKSKTVRVNH